MKTGLTFNNRLFSSPEILSASFFPLIEEQFLANVKYEQYCEMALNLANARGSQDLKIEDLDTNQFEGERTEVLRQIDVVHGASHIADPVDVMRQFLPFRVCDLIRDHPEILISSRLAELAPFAVPLCKLLKHDDPQVREKAAHVVWHIPASFAHLCELQGFDPVDFLQLVDDFIKMPGGRVLLERHVSPEVADYDLPREYALQILIAINSVDGFKGYQRPAPTVIECYLDKAIVDVMMKRPSRA